MMNKDMPAMPPHNNIFTCNNPKSEGYRLKHEGFGLTKREHYAGLAMQSIYVADTDNSMTYKNIAEGAVKMADALLEELDK